MPLKDFLFTSESVNEGHPDKMCDQISDAVLDALIAEDPNSRVALESLAKTGLIVLAGEITSRAHPDFVEIARKTALGIGYDDIETGFDAKTCAVLMAIEPQSADISQGVTEGEGLHKEQGAGDQGLMFGFACDETPEQMPLPIALAHQLMENITKLRKEQKIDFLRPDGKSQVTVRYVDGRPEQVTAVVVSTQHKPNVSHSTIREVIIEELIKKTIPARYLDQLDRFPRKSYRQFRHRRTAWRLRADRAQDHRRYLWRIRQAWRWRLLGQGSEQGRSLGLLHGASCREECGRGRPREEVRNPGCICDRRRGAGFDSHRHLRYRSGSRQEAGIDDSGAVRFPSRRHHQDALAETPDLSGDRGLRTFRPHAASMVFSRGKKPTWPMRCASAFGHNGKN